MTPAGKRRCYMDVQKHDGSVISGETTVGADECWKTVLKDLPVSFREVIGGEVVRGRQMEATTTALLTTVYSPETAAITARHRLLFGTRKLNVVNVLDSDGMQRELAIQVEEKR